jgi:hypothetical protein
MRPPLCALGGSARPGTLHPAFTLASVWVARWGMTPIRVGAAGRDLGQHFFAGTGMPRASGRRGERSRWPSLPLGAQDLRLAFSLGAQGRALLLALPVRIWGCLPPGRRGSCRACRGRGASASPPPPGLEREPVDADAPPAGGPVEHAAHSGLIPSREVSVCSSDIPPIRFRSVVHGQPLDPLDVARDLIVVDRAPAPPRSRAGSVLVLCFMGRSNRGERFPLLSVPVRDCWPPVSGHQSLSTALRVTADVPLDLAAVDEKGSS